MSFEQKHLIYLHIFLIFFGQHGIFLPLDLLVVAFSLEFLNILLAVPLLCLALLLKDLYSFIKSLYSCPFHLDFLKAEAQY